MGKINEYQRQKLASAAVGTTQPSKAGQIIGHAVANFGAVIRGREKERARQNDVFSDLRANSHLMDTVSGMEKIFQGLQFEFAANPELLPAKFQEESTKLIEEYAGNIPNEQVLSKYVRAATSVSKQMGLRTLDWAADKQKENGNIDIIAIKDKAIRIAGGTSSIEGVVSGVNMLYEGVWNNVTQGDEDTDFMSTIGLTYDQLSQAEEDGEKKILEAHLLKRVEEEPQRLKDDIKQGVYKNLVIPVDKRVGDKTENIGVKIPFTFEMEKDILKKADASIVAIEKEKKKFQKQAKKETLEEQMIKIDDKEFEPQEARSLRDAGIIDTDDYDALIKRHIEGPGITDYSSYNDISNQINSLNSYSDTHDEEVQKITSNILNAKLSNANTKLLLNNLNAEITDVNRARVKNEADFIKSWGMQHIGGTDIWEQLVSKNKGDIEGLLYEFHRRVAEEGAGGARIDELAREVIERYVLGNPELSNDTIPPSPLERETIGQIKKDSIRKRAEELMSDGVSADKVNEILYQEGY